MTYTFEEVLEAAKSLDRDSQILLREELAAGIAPNAEHSKAWIDESLRRIEAIKRGEMQSEDASVVMARLRSRLGL